MVQHCATFLKISLIQLKKYKYALMFVTNRQFYHSTLFIVGKSLALLRFETTYSPCYTGSISCQSNLWPLDGTCMHMDAIHRQKVISRSQVHMADTYLDWKTIRISLKIKPRKQKISDVMGWWRVSEHGFLSLLVTLLTFSDKVFDQTTKLLERKDCWGHHAFETQVWLP